MICKDCEEKYNEMMNSEISEFIINDSKSCFEQGFMSAVKFISALIVEKTKELCDNDWEDYDSTLREGTVEECLEYIRYKTNVDIDVYV